MVVHAAGPRVTALPATFAALSDPTRLAAIRLLAEHPLRSSAVAEALSVSRAVASRHLRVLHEVGLVREEPVPGDARGRRYALEQAPLQQVRSFLDEIEAFWTEQLASFKAFAEGEGE